MTSIKYLSSSKALLKGAKTVLVVSTGKKLSVKMLTTALGADKQARHMAELVVELARELQAGEMGAGASTLVNAHLRGAARNRGPRVLLLGLLPEKYSRYNSPSRAESIRRLVTSSGIAKGGKSALLMILDDEEHMLAAMNAIGRALPLFNRKSGKRKDGTLQVMAVTLAKSGTKTPKPLRITRVIKETVSASRDVARLVDTPPTECNPSSFAKEAKRMLRGIPNVRVREIVGSELLRAGLCGLHAVGRAAIDEPRMLVASFRPSAQKKGKHVALVGKGVTYDTGGLNIKTGGHMYGMKTDMGGAAAVLGAFRVLARTGCKHRLSLVLCLAENAVGPNAYKPDDILNMHSGKTVEINNTDAEGRILLADGVSYAGRKLNADHVLDAATLTGAQLVSTGILHAAIFSNRQALEELFVQAGRSSGDLVHPLPFAPEFYKAELRSAVADMKNSVKNRMNAQSSCAAQFIYWHIEDLDVAWCHVDLAGPAFNRQHATGFGVALLAEAVRRL